MNSEVEQGKRQKAEGRGARIARLCLLPSAFCLFVVLATLNSAGYRYGASDQAFYVPAVLLRLDPALFPRDTPVIQAQARLTGFDEVGAALARLTRAPLPPLLLALYALTLVLLATGAWRLGSTFYRQRWTALALMAALTLRHAITKSGTNTLEGYFHPRQLAFALGLLALGSFLRGGLAVPAALVIGAGVLHPTTALWFAVWLTFATFINERRMRPRIVTLAVCAAAAAAWTLTAGPLRGRLITMDAAWLEALATKDYLFPLRWPADVWAINLVYVPIILWAYRSRRRLQIASVRERGLVAGCLSCLVLFLALLPLQAMRVALAVQLQPARMFWMLDLLATVYVVWIIAEGPAPRPGVGPANLPPPRPRRFAEALRAKAEAGPYDSPRHDSARSRRAMIAAVVIAMLSLARGLYLKFVLFPARPIVQAGIQDDDWGRVMRWARQTDRASGWLADPGHAAMYGTSVRVAGERDVLVEAIKDGAIGMYERDIALRVRERVEAIGDFQTLSPARARDLAAAYHLDYLVTARSLDMPLAFQSGPLHVYRLR
jgi:hypothetical protein